MRTITRLSLIIIAAIAGCGPRGNLTIEEKRQAIVHGSRVKYT